jgi:hypothetical protein
MDGARRDPRWVRPLQVFLRTVHILAMALVLGGLAQGAPAGRLRPWLAGTVLSGIALLALDLRRGAGYLAEGAGAAVVLKLALLGLGGLFPGSRLAWYVAATCVASAGSHMSRAWRHHPLLSRGGAAPS